MFRTCTMSDTTLGNSVIRVGEFLPCKTSIFVFFRRGFPLSFSSLINLPYYSVLQQIKQNYTTFTHEVTVVFTQRCELQKKVMRMSSPPPRATCHQIPKVYLLLIAIYRKYL